MKWTDVLTPLPTKAVISIVGGGGKTATMFSLAKELKNSSVLMTTTTKIMRPQESTAYEVLDSQEQIQGFDNHCPVVYGIPSPQFPGKLTGCDFSFIKKMQDSFDYVIVESDGSAGRPLKAPKSHEPVVFPHTNFYIGVIGVECLGKVADDSTVHRPETFSDIRKKNQNELISDEDIITLINHQNGLFKNAPEKCRKVILLNKADLISEEKGFALLDKIANHWQSQGTVVLNSYRRNGIIAFRSVGYSAK